MTRTVLLVLACGLACAVAAVALMPARVFHALVLQPRGIEAAQITGTVWNGQWHDLRLGAARLTHLEGALHGTSLLRGRAVLQVRLSDPRGRGEGRMILADGSVTLQDVSGRIVPAGLVPLAGPARAVLAEPVIFSEVQARFGPRGCETASGAVRFARLLALDAQGGGSLPVLDGALECAGSLPAIRFAGETADVRISGHVRFGAGSAAWSLESQPRTDTITMALYAMGFEDSGDGLRADGQAGWSLR